MNVSHPEKQIQRSCVLDRITVPAEVALVIRTCHADPLREVSRRMLADAEKGSANGPFWSSVRKILLAAT